MTRGYLTNYLITQDCYPDDSCKSEVSQLWRNAINGQVCFVPHEEELSTVTYGHIIYELKIDPPLEYDADYHVYISFREHNEKNLVRSWEGN